MIMGEEVRQGSIGGVEVGGREEVVKTGSCLKDIHQLLILKNRQPVIQSPFIGDLLLCLQ